MHHYEIINLSFNNLFSTSIFSSESKSCDINIGDNYWIILLDKKFFFLFKSIQKEKFFFCCGVEKRGERKKISTEQIAL